MRLREPVSGLTHLLGALLSVAGLVLLLWRAVLISSAWHIVSFAVFGASLILLYTASTLYHLLPLSERGILILRRVDHMMIYLLIAGTYTPICLVPLRGPWGWGLFGGIWGLAVAGIILKAVWIGAPRLLSTLFYLGMGWLLAVAFLPLLRNVPAAGLAWLVAGGLLYSLGAAFYGAKWPAFKARHFGFHEIFHLFVLGGSFCHWWLMHRFITVL